MLLKMKVKYVNTDVNSYSTTLCSDYTLNASGTESRLKEKYNCKQDEGVLTILYPNIEND